MNYSKIQINKLIKNADIIYTIDKGVIENKGDHKYLIENSAVYKKLQLQESSNED